MSIDELKYWLALAKIQSIGPIKFQKILDYFPNLGEFWSASLSEIIEAGIEPRFAEDIIMKRDGIDPDKELAGVQKFGISLITLNDKSYPKLLKEIYAAPPLLYCFGKLDLDNDFPLAVVGTRKITTYGKQVTETIAGQLAAAGITIISGLALGIDACAHQAAVDNGGKTIAVLGSSLDDIFPATNRRLAKNIIDAGGAIISEFPLGTRAFKSNFPRRNRIISGLSLGTLVTEAGIKSGALITARYALEQNREVFAVPGNIFNPLCAGPNYLIKEGAKSVSTAADVLETLNLKQARTYQQLKIVMPENETEKIILEILSAEPLHVDKLSQLAKLDISVINSAIAVMEMKGMIKNLGGQVYVKAR